MPLHDGAQLNRFPGLGQRCRSLEVNLLFECDPGEIRLVERFDRRIKRLSVRLFWKSSKT